MRKMMAFVLWLRDTHAADCPRCYGHATPLESDHHYELSIHCECSRWQEGFHLAQRCAVNMFDNNRSQRPFLTESGNTRRRANVSDPSRAFPKLGFRLNQHIHGQFDLDNGI